MSEKGKEEKEEEKREDRIFQRPQASKATFFPGRNSGTFPGSALAFCIAERKMVSCLSRRLARARWTRGLSSGQYFRPVEVRNGVAIIRFDAVGQKMNTLNDGLQAEAETMWQEQVASRSDVTAAVFISAKPDNFIAGADISMLKAKKAAGEEDSLLAACELPVSQCVSIRKSCELHFAIKRSRETSCPSSDVRGSSNARVACDSGVALQNANRYSCQIIGDGEKKNRERETLPRCESARRKPVRAP